MGKSKLKCAECGRPPKKITSYKIIARDSHSTPDEVAMKVMSYNPKSKQFWCPDCLYDLGLPKGKAP